MSSRQQEFEKEQVVALQKELLEKDTNRVPLGHVQDVCLSALEEIEAVEAAFNGKLNVFKNHARIGLEAIINLQMSGSSKEGKVEGAVTERSKVNPKLGVLDANQFEPSDRAKVSKPAWSGKENTQ